MVKVHNRAGVVKFGFSRSEVDALIAQLRRKSEEFPEGDLFSLEMLIGCEKSSSKPTLVGVQIGVADPDDFSGYHVPVLFA